MLDIKFIRDNKIVVKDAISKKHIDLSLDILLRVDEKRIKLLGEVEMMRSEQNEVSEKIAKMEEDEERKEMIDQMKELKERLQKREGELKNIMKRWQLLMLQVPNIPDISVPEGSGDEDNQELRRWGDIPQFSFTPKGHIELMEDLDMIDLKRGAKVAGFRGYFLKNDGVLLNFSLWQFVYNHFASKGDFTPIMTPSLVNKESFVGTGYLPQGKEDLYKTQDDSYLAGTSEVATMAYYSDEVLEKKDLPIKFFAFSPCFRREAGSYGADTKGIMRVHEFFKFEQIVLSEANHEESVRHHEELTVNAEELLQALEIPYHVVVNCGGDLGLGQVKKYDLEAWVPSEGKYRETHSSSYFHDFQSRRLNIKYRDDDGTLKFVHSLNNTAIATPRILIPIIENNQQEDGSILIPKVLQKYTGKDRISI